MTIKTKFDLGQKVWYYKHVEARGAYQPCPVCGGKSELTIKVAGKPYEISCPAHCINGKTWVKTDPAHEEAVQGNIVAIAATVRDRFTMETYTLGGGEFLEEDLGVSDLFATKPKVTKRPLH